MTKRRIYISAFLMILAICAIGFFQGFYLYKTYDEEKETLNIRTNVLFRESVFESQAASLNSDTSLRLPVSNRLEAIRVINRVKTRLQDSSKTQKPTVVIGYGNRHPDSVAVGNRGYTRIFHRRPTDPASDTILPGSETAGAGTIPPAVLQHRTFNIARSGDVLFEVLRGVDLGQDSLTVPEVSRYFKAALDKEKIFIPFDITKTAVQDLDTNQPRERLESANEVWLGFDKPVKFALHLQETNRYLLRKMLPQILVSLLLVALTTFSFVVLFRNLIKQRKLTKIKNDFISNITHELKTPIATVSVAVEALKNFNALDDAKRTEEYLSISANELQRLSMLVDKVLKLSMFEKQEIELNAETFDLKMVIEEVVESMKLQFEKYKAAIRMELSNSPVLVKADRLHITSVIYNLVDNALKYSKDKPEIRIGLREAEHQLAFSVEDNGPGIPAEYREKIFEKFFRIPTGNQHNVKGYGLGLSYVAYVIRRHDGHIDVNTAPGAGSSFTVTLPKGL